MFKTFLELMAVALILSAAAIWLMGWLKNQGSKEPVDSDEPRIA